MCMHESASKALMKVGNLRVIRARYDKTRPKVSARTRSPDDSTRLTDSVPE